MVAVSTMPASRVCSPTIKSSAAINHTPINTGAAACDGYGNQGR
jgi:hypothetical protein